MCVSVSLSVCIYMHTRKYVVFHFIDMKDVNTSEVPT